VSGGAGTQPPPAATADKVTSFKALKCASPQKARNLVVQASMPENGTITVGGTVSVPNASKVFKIKAVSVKAVAGKTVSLKVKLAKKALKAIKKALKRHKKVKAKLSIIAKDTAGNTKTEKRSVKLK
jgi:hydroxymethylglutaryl-CoA reductase